MFLWFLLVLLLLFVPSRLDWNGPRNQGLSRETSNVVKGAFILLVFASHFVGYVKLGAPLDQPYLDVRKFLAQLVVVPFLFYSGYGVMASVSSKGDAYIRAIPYRRILRVLFQFGCAVLLFVGLRAWLGTTYEWQKLLLTFLAWDGIGNSNWYIFAILNLYLCTYLSAVCFGGIQDARTRDICRWWMLVLLTTLFVAIISKYRPAYWYNTVFAYVAGAGYFLVRPIVERYVMNSKATTLVFLLASVCSVWVLGTLKRDIVTYQSWSVCFALAIVFATSLVVPRNPFLAFCGRHLFSLYILQRLPMLALQKTAVAQHVYSYFAICFVLTFVLALPFDFVVDRLWRLLAKPWKH